MRRIVLHQHQSLDGIVTNLEKWMKLNDDIMQDGMDFYDELDAAIFGGNTYPLLRDYWVQAEQSSTDPLEKKFAKKINAIEKYVISRSAVDLTWNNSKQILITNNPESLIAAINDLKKGGNGKISVDSGVGLWHLFLQHNLFDELLVYIHPVIAGEGEFFFVNPVSQTALELTSQKTYKDGTLELRYQRKA